MSFTVLSETTIIKCTNRLCQARFSVIVYAYADPKCTSISTAKMIPNTGNTPYFCPCCGKNLGKPKGT